MSLSLQQVIDASRDADSTFAPTRVPNAVFARFLSRYQKRLVGKATEVRPGIITSQISVVFPSPGLPNTSPIGSIGAGTGTGLPVGVNTAGVPYGTTGQSVIEAVVGNSVELDFPNAIVYVAPTAVTATSATTITALGTPNWTINQWGSGLYYVEIITGTDVTDRRLIVSNTTNALTVNSAFAVTPDLTSMFRIVLPSAIVTNETSAVIGLPATGTRTSYLVEVNAQGQAFIDLTAPQIAVQKIGMQLPQYKSLLEGTVYFTPTSYGDQDTQELTFVDSANRLRANGRYNAYDQNNQLFLIGNADDWQLVQSIDIRYVPEPAFLTQLTDLFVVPDSAYDCLVAAASQFAAERVFNAQDTKNVDVGKYRDAAMAAEQEWLFEIGAQHRAKTSYVRETW